MFRVIDSSHGTRMFKLGGSRRQQCGFSLLEILVAFSILAVSLGILNNIFSTGMRTAMVAEEYTSAVQIANSLMAKTGVETLLQAGQTTGIENDKYRWEVVVSPFQLAVGEIDTASIPAELYMVTVTVNWGGDDRKARDNERGVELSELKITGKANAPQSN